MDIISALILGLVQGFSEWLPISSSGHLVIAHQFFSIPNSAEFDITLMLGTTLALAIYFREKLFWILSGLLKNTSESKNYLLLIILAGIPTAIIGFAGRKFFKTLFYEPLIVCAFIFITGIFLFFASRAKVSKSELENKDALLVGVAQGIAVAPGISRSGSTIGTALLLGVEPAQAAQFSFIIGLPAMAVASVLEFASASYSGIIEYDAIAAGFVASFLAGYVSIGFFMEILKRGKLIYFAYYCLIAPLIFAALILFF